MSSMKMVKSKSTDRDLDSSAFVNVGRCSEGQRGGHDDDDDDD